MAPGISFILAMYRGAATVADCLRHLQALHFTDWECIAVDDASPDACATIVEEHARSDQRIRLVRRETNGGVSAARNTGLEQARGRYCHFLDQDDFLRPDGIGALVRFLSRRPGLAGAFGHYRFRHLETGAVHDAPEPLHTLDFSTFARGNHGPPLVFLADRMLAQEVGGLQSGLEGCDDWDLWARMARTGRDFAFVSAVVGDYSVHDANNTLNCRRMVKSGLAVLDRLYAPDPRVPCPAPAWQSGGDPSQKLPTAQAILWSYVAICCARHDLPAALDLLACYQAHTQTLPDARSFAFLHEGMFFASVVTGLTYVRYYVDLREEIDRLATQVEAWLGQPGWGASALDALHERYVSFLLAENQQLRQGMTGILRSRSYRLSRLMSRGLGRVLTTLGVVR